MVYFITLQNANQNNLIEKKYYFEYLQRFMKHPKMADLISEETFFLVKYRLENNNY